MRNIKITDELYNEISEYCKLNSLQINEHAEELLKQALVSEKYGDIPFGVIPHLKEGPFPVEETIPVQPMTEPNEFSVLAKADKVSRKNDEKTESGQETRQNVSITESEERIETTNTNKEEVKPKKRRL